MKKTHEANGLLQSKRRFVDQTIEKFSKEPVDENKKAQKTPRSNK